MTFQGGSYDKAIRRITVHVGQQSRSGGDFAVDGDLDESLSQERLAPGSYVAQQRKPALVVQHRDFPEGDCRYCDIPLPHRAVDLSAGVHAEMAVAEPRPYQDLRTAAVSKQTVPVLAGLGFPFHVDGFADVAGNLDDVAVAPEPTLRRLPVGRQP